MKTRLTPQRHSSAANALLIVLGLTAATLVVLGASMSRTTGTATMNARNNQYLAGLYAAEAATEKVFAMMKADFLGGNLTYITNHLSLYRGAVPTSSDGPSGSTSYWGQ